MMEDVWCPCPSPWEAARSALSSPSYYYDDDMATTINYHHRLLQEEEAPPQGETWEMVYVGIVLIVMFAVLLSDRIGVVIYYMILFVFIFSYHAVCSLFFLSELHRQTW